MNDTFEIKFDAASRRRLDQAGREFLATTLNFETSRRENTSALIELAHVLTSLGRHDESLRADEKLARLQPDDPIIRYNLACSLALLDRRDEAFSELDKAIELGYHDVKSICRDKDLKTLREDPRFAEIIRRLREHAPQESRESKEE
ncbi:MAG: hypothetical protein HY286_03110 [Planctomycetes bacterium]|nr:hypothetical protein [Planctomycetota bacterium]